MINLTWYLLLIGFATVGSAPALPGQPVSTVETREVRIAAASDLKFALEELARGFEEVRPAIQLKPSYGSSGSLYAMIQNRAPFDVFLSADIEYPRRLALLGLGIDTNVFVYGRGRIVLWVPKTSRLDVESAGMQILLDPSIRRIAIANPKHAPYGRAAKAAMQWFKLYDQVGSKLVLGENITQAMQFAQSGAADIGIVALSIAAAPHVQAQGRYWQVPLDSYPRLEQGGLILKWAKHPAAARAFRDYLLSEPGCAVLNRYGFLLAE